MCTIVIIEDSVFLSSQILLIVHFAGDVIKIYF